MNVEDAFKYLPVLIPAPIFEVILREFEHGDVDKKIKKKLVELLHQMLEKGKKHMVLEDGIFIENDYTISSGIKVYLDEDLNFVVEDASERDFVSEDWNEMVNFISKFAGVSTEDVSKVLKGLTAFFQKRMNDEEDSE